MHRSLACLAALACVFALACDSTSGCLEIDGPCVSTTPVPRTFILGLDPATLDRLAPVNANGYRAVLPVGATVTLRAVRDAVGEVTQASDTLRAVTWVLSDVSSATLTPSTDGTAQLVATKVGRIGTILANGSSVLYACTTAALRACSAVGAIDVVAR